jgi:hypothetical protein
VSEQSEELFDRLEDLTMTVLETVALYYDAWQNKRGDFSEVPLADDFEFIGPVASFRQRRGLSGDGARGG